MITREAVVAEARSWVGTPWRHQSSLKGVASDCIGLVRGVARQFCIPEAELFANDPRFRGYGRTPQRALLLEAVGLYLVPVDVPQIADILLMQHEPDPDPRHFAIITALDPMYIVHAYAQMRKVVENRVDEKWRARVVGAFAFKGLA